MIKKEIFTGLFMGVLTTILGIVLITLSVSLIKNSSFEDTLSFYLSNSALWMLIALGSIPNLLVFFFLLKKNKDYRARGVVMATFVSAIIAFSIYFGIL